MGCCKNNPKEQTPDCMAARTVTLKTQNETGEQEEQANINLATGEITYGEAPCPIPGPKNDKKACGCKK